jgi:hypothetical protein
MLGLYGVWVDCVAHLSLLAFLILIKEIFTFTFFVVKPADII